MEYWILTDEEKRALGLSGGDVAIAQQAKRQAFIDNGGVILNSDALEDMYRALKLALVYIATNEIKYGSDGLIITITEDAIINALAKAKGK